MGGLCYENETIGRGRGLCARAAASGATFDVSGTFFSPQSRIYLTVADLTNPPPYTSGAGQLGLDFFISLSGTITITGEMVTSLKLTVGNFANPAHFDNLLASSLSNVSPDGLSWSLDTSFNHGGLYGGNLNLTDTNGRLTAGSLYYWSEPGQPPPNIFAYEIRYPNLSGTVIETPIPAALPLFATGLGALGLLGWRRKRKAAAVA